MSKPKRLRIRDNVQNHVDMDYFKQLDKEDREYINQFVDEYYCGGYGKEHSLHRRAYGEDYLRIKKDMENMMNAQNRCAESITFGSEMLYDVQDFSEMLPSTEAEGVADLLKTNSPIQILNSYISEYSDLIHLGDQTPEELMRELSLKAISLFSIVEKERRRTKAKHKEAPRKRTKPKKKQGSP